MLWTDETPSVPTENEPLDHPHAAERGPGSFDLAVYGHQTVVYDKIRGPRGGEDIFSLNRLGADLRRPFERSSIGLRAEATLEPAMGKTGYPLLFQTGGTADGRTTLVDRQHPHEYLSELSLSGDWRFSPAGSLSIYAALPGEPAAGVVPAAHRFSGAENPEAPLSEHGLDPPHISYGVLTVGAAWKGVTLEGSAFRGREPDHNRRNIESPKLDSGSGRLTVIEGPWTFRTAYAFVNSPHQIFPTDDDRRLAASLTHSFHRGAWEGELMAAWGRNWHAGIDTLESRLLEGAIRWRDRHTLFGRAERVERDDLLTRAERLDLIGAGLAPRPHPFHNDPLVTNRVFAVRKATLGYVFDLWRTAQARWGLGASASVHDIPRALELFYGRRPSSFLLFTRLRFGEHFH